MRGKKVKIHRASNVQEHKAPTSKERLEKDNHGVKGINDFPAEILARILTSIVMDGLQENKWLVRMYTPLSAALRLCAVCSLWHNTAITTPRLWTKLRINFQLIQSRGAGEELARHLNTWIKRSGELPLTLYIPYSAVLVELSMLHSSHIGPTKEIIRRYAHRCEAIHIGYDYDRENQYDLDYFYDDLMNTPSSWGALRRLGWHFESDDFNIHRKLPLAQLRHLHIESRINPDLLLTIFTDCPCLVGLDIDHVGGSSSRPIPTVHRGLRRFRVYSYNGQFQFDYLMAMTLPSLVDLRLALGMGVKKSDLETFLKRSGCKLETLNLQDMYHLHPDELASILEQESCHSLIGLVLGYSPCSVKAQHYNFILANALRPCQNLSYLLLGTGYPDILVDLLESRVSPEYGVRLQMLSFRLVDRQSDYQCLEDFAMEHDMICRCTIDYGIRTVTVMSKDSQWPRKRL